MHTYLSLVATLVSYLGSKDAADSFIAPSATEVWITLATALEGETQPSQLKWPGLSEGVVLAGQQLFFHCGSSVHVRRLVAATIRALVEKSALVRSLYADAKEMVLPIPATAEDVAWHCNPIASSSFYYFNEGGKPLYSLRGYETEEADSAVNCSKTVRQRPIRCSLWYCKRHISLIYCVILPTFSSTSQRQGPTTEKGSTGFMLAHCATCGRSKGGHALITEGRAVF